MSDRLSFKEQLQVVWQGAKKGVKFDGCSGVPDFNFGSDCCGEHDVHYQLADISRAEADKKLFHCILKKGYFLIAISYYLGVRVFGRKYYAKNLSNSSRIDP